MDERGAADVARLLVGEAPRRQANALLEHLTMRLGAAGGGILVDRAGQVIVFASCELAVTRLTAMNERWTAAREILDLGRPFLEGTVALYPLEDSGTMPGVLYLEGLPYADLSAVGPYVVPMAQCIVAAGKGSPVVAAPAVTVPAPPESQIERMVRLLDQHDWNIKRVSEIIGVTRKTLYSRLEAYNIERKKMRKRLGPRSKPPTA